MLTDDEKQALAKILDAFCEARVPVMVRDKVVLQYRFEGHDVMLFEKRPRFDDPSVWIESPVVKFRLNKTAGTWSLLCKDRDLQWHHYDRCDPSPDFSTLLKEVDEDPTHIFWG